MHILRGEVPEKSLMFRGATPLKQEPASSRSPKKNPRFLARQGAAFRSRGRPHRLWPTSERGLAIASSGGRLPSFSRGGAFTLAAAGNPNEDDAATKSLSPLRFTCRRKRARGIWRQKNGWGKLVAQQTPTKQTPTKSKIGEGKTTCIWNGRQLV